MHVFRRHRAGFRSVVLAAVLALVLPTCLGLLQHGEGASWHALRLCSTRSSVWSDGAGNVLPDNRLPQSGPSSCPICLSLYQLSAGLLPPSSPVVAAASTTRGDILLPAEQYFPASVSLLAVWPRGPPFLA